MATHNLVHPQKKLSTKLSFFIVGLGIVFVLVVGWQALYKFSVDSPWSFDQRSWLTFLATSVGTLTWFGTTFVTVRNSIKQHTITTLLQMRLSATYMENANKVAAALKLSAELDADGSRLVTAKELLSCFKDETGSVEENGELALRYVLNYFEFLAIGISRGDFDEQMLYDSLGTILQNNVRRSRQWIEGKRAKTPDVYCHLAWLFERWCPEDMPLIERGLPAGMTLLRFK